MKLGFNMGYVMVIGLALLGAGGIPWRTRWLAIGGMAIMGGGLLVSGSRTSLVLLLGSAFVMLMLRREFKAAARRFDRGADVERQGISAPHVDIVI